MKRMWFSRAERPLFVNTYKLEWSTITSEKVQPWPNGDVNMIKQTVKNGREELFCHIYKMHEAKYASFKKNVLRSLLKQYK